MSIIHIQSELEHKSLYRRADFINDYNFEEDTDNQAYFLSFVKSFELTDNDWYNTTVIDLANLLAIKDIHLLRKFASYLNTKIDFLTRLMIIDYLKQTYDLYPPYTIDYKSIIEKEVTRKYNRSIVKINSLAALIHLFPKEKNNYYHLLKKHLNNCNDYRAHTRLYSSINNGVANTLTNREIAELILITKSKPFGNSKAIKESISEL